MPASVIREYLLTDVVDTTPAAIRALNPGVWDTDGDVPVYMYTSLCTLWTGSSGDVVNYDRLVSAQSGRGTVTADSITISPIICESVDSSEGPEYMDELGAENARIFITYQQNRLVPDADWGRIESAELRTRLLLDANLRGQSRKPQSLPVVGDTSIFPGNFLCIWAAYANDPDESYLTSEYNISYIRSFGRASIP